MGNTPAVKTFFHNLTVGDTHTPIFDLRQKWEKIYAYIPSMTAFLSTATCNCEIEGGVNSADDFGHIHTFESVHNDHRLYAVTQTPLYTFFRNSAASSGMHIDASGTTATFFVGPGADTLYFVNRIMISYSDGANWRAERYGNLAGALTNGLEFAVVDGSNNVKINLTSNQPITKNSDWGNFCYDFSYLNFGAGDDFAHARWTFEKAGFSVYLNGESGDRLVMYQRDDLSGLSDMKIQAQGYEDKVHTNRLLITEMPTNIQYMKIAFNTTITASTQIKLICTD